MAIKCLCHALADSRCSTDEYSDGIHINIVETWGKFGGAGGREQAQNKVVAALKTIYMDFVYDGKTRDIISRAPSAVRRLSATSPAY